MAENKNVNIYELSRVFWDWAFENPDKIKPNHSAMYFFAIEHCNRLGWKEIFGFPTSMVMEAIGIKSYNTFIKTLNELVEFGFIRMVENSKNQYSANIIALSNFNKALNKALDKALIKHLTKHSESTSESTSESIDSIDIQIYNNTNLQINNSTEDEIVEQQSDKILNVEEIKKVAQKKVAQKKVAQKKVAQKKETLNIPENFKELWAEWIEYRKARKLKPYAGVKWEQVAVDKLLEMSNKDPVLAKKILEQSYQNNYNGFFELKDNYAKSNNNHANNRLDSVTRYTQGGNGRKISARTILADRISANHARDSESGNITIDAEVVR